MLKPTTLTKKVHPYIFPTSVIIDLGNHTKRNMNAMQRAKRVTTSMIKEDTFVVFPYLRTSKLVMSG